MASSSTGQSFLPLRSPGHPTPHMATPLPSGLWLRLWVWGLRGPGSASFLFLLQDHISLHRVGRHFPGALGRVCTGSWTAAPGPPEATSVPVLGAASRRPPGLESSRYDSKTNEPQFLLPPWPPAHGVTSASRMEAAARLVERTGAPYIFLPALLSRISISSPPNWAALSLLILILLRLPDKPNMSLSCFLQLEQTAAFSAFLQIFKNEQLCTKPRQTFLQ